MRRTGMTLFVAVACLAVATDDTLAGKADVVAVRLTKEASGTYTVDVTVKSDDTGWQKYCDKWEVRSPDGRTLGTRELLHPHEDEQPFTRDLRGVAIPADVAEIRVRAHDKVEGWGGAEVTTKVPR